MFAPNGREVFRLKSSEELRSAERGDSPRPAAGQEGRHQGFYPLNSHFLLGEHGEIYRAETRKGTAVGLPQRVFREIFAVYNSVLLHRRFTLRRRGIAVPRNSLTRYTARHLRIKRLVQFILVGAVYHNVLTNCAARLCRTLR